MKITELVHVIEDLGLRPDFDYVLDDDGDEDDVLVVYSEGHSVAVVYVDWIGAWDCYEPYFSELEPHKRHKLLEAVEEYSYTPFIDRKDKKLRFSLGSEYENN